MHFNAVRAFADNYVWLLRRGAGTPAIIVDPGQAEPVIDALSDDKLPPAAILLTHHHPDHIGGVAMLRARYPDVRVMGPTDERVPADERVQPGDTIQVDGLAFDILDLAAHTRGHIGYWGQDALLCGDAIFSLGCGRLFEGTPADLTRVMRTIAALPPQTLLFAAHEYTQANAQFALHVDRDNRDLQEYAADIDVLRSNDQITLPTTLQRELDCNPFLRAHTPAIADAIDAHFGSPSRDDIERMGRLRQWKDTYV